ncbi:MAG: GH116 family glycosyl hydrolase [Bacteroidales bacterium]
MAKKNTWVILIVSLTMMSACTHSGSRFLIPEDKKLSEDWISSLTSRGKPEVWSRGQLRYIGMPVGGIACGQLYLAGDGRLWLWDIFKSNYSREDVTGLKLDLMTMNGHYTKPVDSDGGIYSARNGASVEQGFAIRIKTDSENQFRTLDKKGFPEVSFLGEYPMGKVNYTDKDCPVSVQLEAFSPFIPLDAANSALPATILAFTITNNGGSTAEIGLTGWLQNAACPYDSQAFLGQRQSTLLKQNGLFTLHCEIEPSPGKGLDKHQGFGSLALSLIGTDSDTVYGNPDIAVPLAEPVFSTRFLTDARRSKTLDKKLVGSLGQIFTLAPGQQRTLTFLLTWYFPLHQEKGKLGEKIGIKNPADPDPAFQVNGRLEMTRIKDFAVLNRHYKPWFTSAADVAGIIALKYDSLAGSTQKWNQTWYRSTLPYWLLDRTMIPTDALATQTVHWFDNGRFWGWEGVECCGGTCAHVWNYAQAMSRLFPQFERGLRENIDYGIAFNASTGGIANRAEIEISPAMDGQAGTILRTWREHTMSSDDAFLRRVWPGTKKAIQWLIGQDPKHQGIIEKAQPNTLDATWFGPMGWISSVYCGALRAGQQMATEMGDAGFADTCRVIAENGYANIPKVLFNGEYFIHIPPDYNNINTNTGCHIDQVLGQSWASQLGLPRVLPKAETVSALTAIWKYNFAPDAGGYAVSHNIIKGHRIYAEDNEAGLIMTTWPHGGDSLAVPGMKNKTEDFKTWIGPGGYFDECMTGFEYQVAAHMIYEGSPGSELVRNGLAIARAIHDRYAPEKRNPYNEIECGDHYSRAMAAFGVYLAVCGFEYHGPKGIIGFDPKISPEDFKSAFITAEGWGTFSQKRESGKQENTLALDYGRLNLNQFKIQLEKGEIVSRVTVNGQKTVEFDFSEKTGELKIKLNNHMFYKGEELQIICSMNKSL